MLACIQQVRASSEEQSSTTAHISENVETISQVTHNAVRGNQSIASAMQDLNTLIEDLQHRVSAFHFASTEAPLPEIKVDSTKLALDQANLVHW
jgi:methyl-accepting chemotaxis protein